MFVQRRGENFYRTENGGRKKEREKKLSLSLFSLVFLVETSVLVAVVVVVVIVLKVRRVAEEQGLPVVVAAVEDPEPEVFFCRRGKRRSRSRS